MFSDEGHGLCKGHVASPGMNGHAIAPLSYGHAVSCSVGGAKMRTDLLIDHAGLSDAILKPEVITSAATDSEEECHLNNQLLPSSGEPSETESSLVSSDESNGDVVPNSSADIDKNASLDLLESAAALRHQNGGTVQETMTNTTTSTKSVQLFPLLSHTAIVQAEAGEVTLPLLMGEEVMFQSQTTTGVIVLTNYRIFLCSAGVVGNEEDKISSINVPLGSIDYVEMRDMYNLCIHSKLVFTLTCSFSDGDQCATWLNRLCDVVNSQTRSLRHHFAFTLFKTIGSSKLLENGQTCSIFRDREAVMMREFTSETLSREVERMNFTDCGAWRVTKINQDFTFCPNYPRQLIVPASISDEELEKVASFRSSRRIPTAVWRHPRNGCIIARSSQPEVGWLGWRSDQDEKLLNAFVTSCISPAVSFSSNKLLVLDARSYPAAVANRAKGGGCECTEYYPCSEIQFMGLANIHSIRKSYQSLKCLNDISSSEHSSWLAIIDNSKWLQHISALIKSALVIVTAVDEEARPVLVHCSDGWDRTPQIVSLAELCLDPYYRTIDGFQALVTREWIEFGHKFADRCGLAATMDDPNERCPVFLQWLDCVHQVMEQHPSCFEFNRNYLITLARHVNSCLFGTFMCNNMFERDTNKISEGTHEVWTFLNLSRDQFTDDGYTMSDEVLKPASNVRDMIFWTEAYQSSSVLLTN